jgi:signal transduction histidine kinase
MRPGCSVIIHEYYSLRRSDAGDSDVGRGFQTGCGRTAGLAGPGRRPRRPFPGADVGRNACRRKGREIRIDVCDTGIGIPEDQLLRIFESFTRLAPERSNGLGIGLAIVRRALEMLGHRIEVRSVVGKGSLFSIYAPAAAASAS